MKKREKVLTGAIILLFLAFWTYIAYCVPYTHDDWDWGLDVGLEQWLTASLNNRYVGSFFVVIMTRSVAAKVLVLGGGMFAIPLLMALLAVPDGGEERRYPFLPLHLASPADGEVRRRSFLPLYLAANLLTLLLPPRIWRQTYGWVSGFANYGVSAVFFLGWLLLLRIAFRTRRRGAGVALAVVLLVYTFALGLFVESQSAVDLLFCLALLSYSLVARRGRLPAACALAGAILGVVVIFFNPLYGELVSTGEALGGIRHLIFPAGSTLIEMISSVLQQLFGYLVPLLFQIGLTFSLLLALITFLSLWRGRCRPLCVLAVWPVAYGVLMAFFRTELPEPLVVWGGIVSLVIPCLSVALSGGALFRRLLRLLLLLCGFGMVAPMALVLDVGGRIYILFYLLTALVALDLAAPLLDKRAVVAGAICAVLSVAAMVQWGYAYARILDCSALRKQLILEAVKQGAKEVSIPTDRYEDIEWFRNPEAPHRVVFYRAFYGIPQDLKIVYLPPGSYEHWPDIWPEDRAGAVDFGV